MRFDVTILGSNSAIPAYGRFPTAQVLNVSEQLYLIDSGEGVQWRLQECNIKRGKINQIFISHLHGDHIFGLIGLLNSFSLSKREEPIIIFSPKGLEEIIQVQLKNARASLSFPLSFHDLETSKNQLIFEDNLVEVSTIPLQHRIPTCGFLFKEKPRPLNINPAKIEEFEIPFEKIREIKGGKDYRLLNGKVIPNEELTFPPVNPRSYAFCSDTVYSESIIPIIQNVDLLYHEATFLHEMKDLAAETMHSTAKEAALIAKKAKADQLIIGHYSSRYKDLTPLLDEAQEVFPNTILGTDGKTISVPFKKQKLALKKK
jgi:ribonuclease Z